MTLALHHPPKYPIALAFFISLAIFPLVAAHADDSYYISFVTRVLIFVIATMSLNLILGFGGMVSFGHAGFLGLGAYSVSILMYYGVSTALVSWPAAIAISALASLLIGLITLRTGGVYFIMITLAFAQMLYFIFISLDVYGGDDGMPLAARSSMPIGIDLSSDTAFFYVVLAICALVFFGLQRLVNSRFGRVLQGIQANEGRTEAIGYDVFGYKLVAFVLAGAIAGLAGALLANQTGLVTPSTMYWTQSGTLMIMVICGGVGSLYGSILGPFFILILEEVLSSFTDHWQLPLGIILLAVVIFAPNGVISIGPRRFRHV